MTAPRHDLRLRLGLRAKLKEYQPVTYAAPAKIGDGQGNVEVTNRPGYIWIRMDNKIIPCLNVKMPNIENYPVMVGYDYLNPDVFQVLDTNLSAVAIGDSGEVIYNPLRDHHETHEYLVGHDVVRVYWRTIMDLRVSVKTAFTVTVFRGIVPTSDGSWVEVSTTDIDLSSYQPGSGYRWVLVYVDETGTPGVVAGAATTQGTFGVDDIPQPLPNTFSLAAIRLYDTQTALEENTTTTDIVDLRFPQSWYGGPTSETTTPVIVVDIAGDTVVDNSYTTVTAETST